MQRRGVPRSFDPMQRVARIRGEQPRQIFRFGQRRAMRHGAAQIFPQARAHLPGEGLGCFQPAGERFRAVRQPERFQLGRLAAPSSPTSTKSRVFVTSTSRYRVQYRLTCSPRQSRKRRRLRL